MDFRSESTPANPELINYRTIDLDAKKYACAYCGDRFPIQAYRATHEKENHVDKDGNSLEITCDLCQENLPSPTHYRRHNIDKHKKYNMSRMKYKESYCCDECGKTFKVCNTDFNFYIYLLKGPIKIWTEHSFYFYILKLHGA